MKTFLIIAQVVLLGTLQLQAQISNGQQPDYYLNGQFVTADRISLIYPRNIKKIEVIKDTVPPQVRISTKKILFLTYSDIKKKAGVMSSSSPSIIVDTQEYSNDLLIDKRLVRKIELIKSDTILIKTKFYKQRIEDAKNPPIRIRGEQLPITLHEVMR